MKTVKFTIRKGKLSDLSPITPEDQIVTIKVPDACVYHRDGKPVYDMPLGFDSGCVTLPVEEDESNVLKDGCLYAGEAKKEKTMIKCDECEYKPKPSIGAGTKSPRNLSPYCSICVDNPELVSNFRPITGYRNFTENYTYVSADKNVVDVGRDFWNAAIDTIINSGLIGPGAEHDIEKLKEP